jgi:hypothetical protein
LADSDLSFIRAQRVPQGGKTRTLHKNREECGTRQEWYHPAMSVREQKNAIGWAIR